MANEIYAIYDKIFKRILTLSNVAVINFINGIFEKDFPIGSEIIYNWTENINDRLERTLSDTIITVNQTEKFHIEVQINNDETIVLRVFDYGYQDAIKYKEIIDNRIIIKFPKPKIIFLEHNSNTPDEVILEMDFLEQGKFEYKVPTMKFLSYSIEELDKGHMVILLPLYLLKLKQEIKKSKSKENAKRLKDLIENGIIKTIEKNEKQGNITHEDITVLINLLVLLYKNLYGNIEEFKEEGVDNMIAEKLTTYTEERTIENTKEIARKLLKMGLEAQKIVEATELSLDEILELKSEL